MAYDVDGDNALDVVAPGRAYHADGTLIADTGINADHPAVGDLDNDGTPEVAVVSFAAHSLSVWRVNLDRARQLRDHPPGHRHQRHARAEPVLRELPRQLGLPATAAGRRPSPTSTATAYPDVALAGGIGYVVFDGAKLMNPAVADATPMLWVKSTQDCSSAMTGSSVFDFNGDGTAEVVYGDELQPAHLRRADRQRAVRDLQHHRHAVGVPARGRRQQRRRRRPRGRVELLQPALPCDGSKTSGIRIFGDAAGKWVRTRRIWNQHAYHVTNVEEDGTIPSVELPNYLTAGLNNFRQNRQPEGEFSAPDLVVSISPKCAGDYALVARVRNVGEASVPAGVVVGFYDGRSGDRRHAARPTSDHANPLLARLRGRAPASRHRPRTVLSTPWWTTVRRRTLGTSAAPTTTPRSARDPSCAAPR